MERHTDVCNLPENAPRKEVDSWLDRDMDKWLYTWQKNYCKIVTKADPYTCCLQKTHLIPRETYRVNIQFWKKVYHADGDLKKSGVSILISDKIDFERKAVTRDKEGHYIMIEGSNQEEDITTINIYVPNIGEAQCVRQMLTSMKGDINSNAIWVEDFNMPLTSMDRLTKQN